MSELVNLLDSEVDLLQKTAETLQDRTYKTHNLAAFEREILERFQEVGFRVDVKWFTAQDEDGRPVEGVFMPQVDVVGRCTPLKPGEFDHDQMRHEVVNNYLGLPSQDAGIIKPDEKWTIEQAKEIHKHGPGCEH